MKSLKDFKVKKIETTDKILGGIDTNVTPGGSHDYGNGACATWDSDYYGVDGLEWCDLEYFGYSNCG